MVLTPKQLSLIKVGIVFIFNIAYLVYQFAKFQLDLNSKDPAGTAKSDLIIGVLVLLCTWLASNIRDTLVLFRAGLPEELRSEFDRLIELSTIVGRDSANEPMAESRPTIPVIVGGGTHRSMITEPPENPAPILDGDNVRYTISVPLAFLRNQAPA